MQGNGQMIWVWALIGKRGFLAGLPGSRQGLGWIPEAAGGKKPVETGTPRPTLEKSSSRQGEKLLLLWEGSPGWRSSHRSEDQEQDKGSTAVREEGRTPSTGR